jgi:hypothetical protein
MLFSAAIRANETVTRHYSTILYRYPQSTQSAKLFSIRRNWDSPSPSPAGECVPGGGTHTLAGEGVEGPNSAIPTRGRTLLYPGTYELCEDTKELVSFPLKVLKCEI